MTGMAVPQQVDHDWIQAHIPHQGNMCLLQSVTAWDEMQIECLAFSHADPNNPLRHGDVLPISAGVEYAAQAMAVHGALLAGPAMVPEVGYLTSVRNLHWSSPRLDNVGPQLTVKACRISGNDNSLLYDFSIVCDARLLLSGRAGVLIKPPATATLTQPGSR